MKKRPHNPYSTKPDFFVDKDPLKQAPREAPICQRVRENLSNLETERRQLLPQRSELSRALGVLGVDIDEINRFEREIEEASSLPDSLNDPRRRQNRRIRVPVRIRWLFRVNVWILVADLTAEAANELAAAARAERIRQHSRRVNLQRRLVDIEDRLQVIDEEQSRAQALYQDPNNQCDGDRLYRPGKQN